jgi:putative DNA methylase
MHERKPMTVTRKKLIEVALPLEAINDASAREKSIRHGHPSTLHLWWARRPLAAARAVIFAQMVDDPSSCTDLFPTKKAQERERQRLFRIIEDLVEWENTTNEKVLQTARDEIWQSWRRACADNADHPRSKELFNRNKLPAFADPFAGGGALPLEAQRLGLEAHASDLNPVAVLITKAVIEIPSKFVGKSPVHPEVRKDNILFKREWHGLHGLAEDVCQYGMWMRNEAEKRIGYLYPKIEITKEMARERPDLNPLVGQKLTVMAWLWARTVRSPNPAFANIEVPLASTFMLSTKAGKEAYVKPVFEDGGYRFTVKLGKPKNEKDAQNGTKSGGSHSSFLCLMSGTPMPFEYLRAEGKAGRIGTRLMAIVAEGDHGRVYLAPTVEHEAAAMKAIPEWKPDVEISHWPGRTNVVEYGLTQFGNLFTPRQLVVLTTFSDLVQEVLKVVHCDARTAGLADDGKHLWNGGSGASAYAEAVAVYLALAVDKLADRNSTVCAWASLREHARNTFGRQAIPMVWDFAESNSLSDSSGNFEGGIVSIVAALQSLNPKVPGHVKQADAQSQDIATAKVISTDPPYYDNIGYADLSDFFYVWLRKTSKTVFPDLFTTLAVPKAHELVAVAHRHGSKKEAETFFLNGMAQAMRRLAEQSHAAFPVTIYYAFKQSESERDEGTSSTGWETFLDAVIRADFAITGTWPMRTELGRRMIGAGTNALASSIVLVCRPREANTLTTTRREFMSVLKSELPGALTHLQRGNIAPVDLAQAAIGPGMAVYTRYSKVLDPEGKPLAVREALALINQVLDEALAEQEGDFDVDSRWALAWYEQHGFVEGEFGVANVLAQAKNTGMNGLVEAGIIESRRGKVRLLKPKELPKSWDPATDKRLTTWEMVHHLIRVLETAGEEAAADLVAKLGSKAETARELCYRLYTLCERKKRAAEALSYNGLVQSWPEITRLAREGRKSTKAQSALFEENEE